MLSGYPVNIVQIRIGVGAIFSQESFFLLSRCFDYCHRLCCQKINKITQTISLHSRVPHTLRYMTAEDNLIAFIYFILFIYFFFYLFIFFFFLQDRLPVLDRAQ